MDALQHFLESARNTFDAFAQQVSAAELHAAAELIWSAQAEGNRVHVTGIGKPGHVATYLASLMSSTGHTHVFPAWHGSRARLLRPAGSRGCGNLHFQQRRNRGNEGHRAGHPPQRMQNHRRNRQPKQLAGQLCVPICLPACPRRVVP